MPLVRNCEFEAAYGLDPVNRKARRLGVGLGRNYPAPASEFEIHGSEDVVGWSVKGRRLIKDYKSGEVVPDIANNSQLLFFCAALYLIEGVSEVEGQLVYLAEDGSHFIESYVYDVFAIEDYIDSLAAACRKYDKLKKEYEAGRQISVSQGDHCRYCPSLSHCPAYTQLAARMLPELSSVEQQIASLTPEGAGKAWILLKQIEKVYDRVSDGLKAYARETPIPLPNGDVVRESSFQKKFFSQDAAIERILDLGGKQQDVDACFRSKKISSIRQVKSKE